MSASAQGHAKTKAVGDDGPARLMPVPVLALVYGAGDQADRLLTRFADRLTDKGVRLAGLLQRAPEPGSPARCNMEVEVLPGRERLAISEHRGALARGCRLDAGLLVEALERARAGLATGAQLLILNRFGKVEAEGGGGRDLIAEAMASGIPVVVAVPWRNIGAFRLFAGDLAMEIPLADLESRASELYPALFPSSRHSVGPFKGKRFSPTA